MNKTVQEGLKQLQDQLPSNEFSLQEAEQIHFYAGAAWVLKILFSMNDMTPSAATGVMQGLQDEIDVFYDSDGATATLRETH